MKLNTGDKRALASMIAQKITEDMSINYSRDTEDHDGGVDVGVHTLTNVIADAITNFMG